ncbi:Polycomb group RING finger protein 1 [Euphorbia peplus]|nr:Polycomb group RING finger protein 1 [Euphorbia peplus]
MMMVKVRREKIASCITCPLCYKLLRNATTISECLHSFCKKCIYKKINDEEFDRCPVCNINLGCTPLEKLRADHSLEDLKTKIFSSKREKKVKSIVVPAKPLPCSVSLPVRRKEISLSSLVANDPPPKVLTPPASPKYVPRPSKRLKAIARKSPALRATISIDEHPVKKIDDFHESLSSPQAKTQVQNSVPDTSKRQETNKDSDGPCDEGRGDLWKPLVDVGIGSELKKPNNTEEIPVVETMRLPDPAKKEAEVIKSSIEEQVNKPEVNGGENNNFPTCSSSSIKIRKLPRKRAGVSEGLNFTAQAIVDSSSEYDGKFNPIWFSLIASDDPDEGPPLPQISSYYLRVKDGMLSVSTIKKYLAKRLGLSNEAEVEIWLLGQPLDSTLQLYELVHLWLEMVPTSERIQARVGSSAKDFVMALSYTRKIQSP